MKKILKSDSEDNELQTSQIISKPKNTLFYFDKLSFEEKEIKDLNEVLNFKNKPGVCWVNLESVNQSKILQEASSLFNVHPISLEELLDPAIQARIEDYENHINVFLKTVFYDIKFKKTITRNICLVIGVNFLILFQKSVEGNILEPVRDKIRSNKGNIRIFGTDYLTSSVLELVVDNYSTAIEKLSEKINCVEDELIKKPTSKTLHEIHLLKRELIFLHKSALSLGEVISRLQKSSSPLIKKETKMFFQETYDHIIQITRNIETFRDILSDMLEIYLSSLTNKTNEVIRVLTIISTIFIPPTFIVGIYGMNFEYMPELKAHLGYPLVMLGIAAVIALMLLYFKKNKWF